MRSYFRAFNAVAKLLAVKIVVGWVLILCTALLRPDLSNLGFLAWCAMSAGLYLVAVVPFYVQVEEAMKWLGRP